MVKTITLSALGCLLAANVAMAVPFPTKPILVGSEMARENGATPTLTFEGVTYPVTYGAVTPRKAPMQAPTTPIIRIAQGTAQNYIKSSMGSYTYIDEYGIHAQEYNGDALAATIVWGDNSEVYFKDIISYAKYNTYVKGTVSGNIISVPMNQTIEKIDNNNAYNVVCFRLLPYFDGVASTSGQVFVELQYDPEMTEMQFIIDDNGNITLDAPLLPSHVYELNADGELSETPTSLFVTLPKYVIGLISTETDEWAGYFDFSQTYDVFNTPVMTMPAGVEAVPFSIIDSFGDINVCSVAETEDAVYIKGMDKELRNAVLKIEKRYGKNNTVFGAIPQNQVLGVYYVNYILSKVAVVVEPNKMTQEELSRYPLGIDKGQTVILPDNLEYYVFLDYDEDGVLTGIRTMNDDSDRYLYFNMSQSSISAFIRFHDIELESFDNGDEILVPEMPYDVYWTDEFCYIYQLQGFSDLAFKNPTFSVDGRLLDPYFLGYTVYVDDVAIVFEQHEGTDLLGKTTTMYPGVLEPTTIMSVEFFNGVDLVDLGGNYVDVGIYIEHFDTIGVAAVYRNYNGVVTYSDISYFDPGAFGDFNTGGMTSGVDELKGDVKTVEYYDFNGRRINNPENGIFIKRTINNDGSVSVRKQVVK